VDTGTGTFGASIHRQPRHIAMAANVLTLAATVNRGYYPGPVSPRPSINRSSTLFPPAQEIS